MEHLYDFQEQSTNTSLKSVDTRGPSRRVIENILHVAEAECELMHQGRRMRLKGCFQHINVNTVRIKVCLN